MGSHILRNNNLAQEIQNGSGMSGSGNVVSVGLSGRAEASKAQGFSPAVKSLKPLPAFIAFIGNRRKMLNLRFSVLFPLLLMTFTWKV